MDFFLFNFIYLKCLKHSKSHEIKEEKVAKLVVDYVKVTKSLRKKNAKAV